MKDASFPINQWRWDSAQPPEQDTAEVVKDEYLTGQRDFSEVLEVAEKEFGIQSYIALTTDPSRRDYAAFRIAECVVKALDLIVSRMEQEAKEDVAEAILAARGVI